MLTTRSFCASPCRLPAALALLMLLGAYSIAPAVQVQEIIRLKGQEHSKLVGMGLVIGLSGTGDGGDFAPAMRPLAEVTARLIDPTAVAHELADSRNVALVALTAELPAVGVREGDKVDVHIACVGPAKSLAGGRLFLIPMTGPLPDSPVFAYAEGAVTIEDEDHPTVGVVAEGAQLARPVLTQTLDPYGRLQLVIKAEQASWPMAHNLASLINGLMSPDGPPIAKAVDAKNVVVHVPEAEQRDPAGFISQVLEAYLDPSQVGSGAKVVINERTGTIVVSGDVEVSPVIISHKGLTITTITPQREPTVNDPAIDVENFVAVDPADRGGAKLADLLAAFNGLKVPAEDRIDIIKLIHKSGKLHATLILE